jgi:transcriptional regulator with XRE-family HTH domain
MIEFWIRFNELKPSNDTQESIADRIGVSKNTLYNWISKGQYPRASEAVLLANELRTTVEYLVTGSDNSGITREEWGLLVNFRQLDKIDKDEIIEIIKIKKAKEDKFGSKPADKQSMAEEDQSIKGKGA